MASLKDKYAIVGVGHSALGKVPELSDYGLQVTAVKAALDDAGLKKTDVDAVITHSHLLGAVRVHHQMLSERLGIDTAFGVSLSSGGATSCLMVQMAAAAIEAGFCETVLCVHGDKGATRKTPGRGDGGGEFGPEYGLYGAAGQHAFGLTRHMHEYGNHPRPHGRHRRGLPQARATEPRGHHAGPHDPRGLPQLALDRVAVPPVRLLPPERRRRRRHRHLGGARPGHETEAGLRHGHGPRQQLPRATSTATT